MKRSLAIILITSLLMIGGAIAWLLWDNGAEHDGERSVRVTMQMQGANKRIALTQQEDGSYLYVVHRYDGSSESMTPQQFAEYIYTEETKASLVARVLNISSPLGMIWVGIGLLGQVLFTGRMIVQWVVSEKKRRSVVPPMFWWLSLIGAMMLLAYFLWRRDVVGVLGQATGAFIYIRNLHMILFPSPLAEAPAARVLSDQA